MLRVRTAGRVLALLVAATLALGAVACSKRSVEPELKPKIFPPTIAEAGVLRAGVDLDYPPSAGVDKGTEAGIDVDVAAAIAERLGLRLRLVDVGETGVAAARGVAHWLEARSAHSGHPSR
jgi:polar amino acid transport system substrate-binding protein